MQKVHGQILVDGRPAALAQVLFHPAEGNNDATKPTGQTDEQGYFTLTSYVNGDGASPGDYRVTVTWFRVYTRGQEVARYNALPQRYANPQSSQLQVSVAMGNTELSPLELSSR
jgi:hypothetical protein